LSTIILELYEAFRAAGVDDAKAKAAAGAVVGGEGLATKADVSDLCREIADAKAELIRWNVGTIIAMTAVFAAIVKLL
jgi:hypothetical protein